MTKKEKRKERRIASARTKAESNESGFVRTAIKTPKGTSFFSPTLKPHRLSLIPYEVSQKGNKNADVGFLWYERTFYVHRGVGAEEQIFCCPRRNFDKKCPICEHKAKIARDPKTDKKMIAALEPKVRQLFNVFDHGEPEKGVQLWDISFYNFGEALDEKVKNGDDGEYDTFFQPEDGYMLKVAFKDKSFDGGRPFKEVADMEFKLRKEDLTDEQLEAAADLDTLLIEVPYDKLKKIFLQSEDEDDVDDDDDDDMDEDEDETPKKKSSVKKKKVEDDDDEDQDEDEDDDEEEEEEEPKKKSSSKKSKPVDDDDEDDEDDDDDDDEPTAKSKGIKVGSMVKHKKFGKCEVVHISGDGTSLRLKDEDDDLHKAVGVSEVEIAKKTPSKDEEEDDDENPTKKEKSKKTQSGSKSSKADADDEDDDDDEPKKKPSGKKKPADDFDDDEDDEDDDDDDDDEPAPKKSGKKKSRE